MQYSVDFFISKFEAIPEEEWTTGTQQNEIGQRCAFGHCMPEEIRCYGRLEFGFGHTTDEGIVLWKLLRSPARINNGKDLRYPQPTPKQRILAALYDIKANQAVDQAQEIANTKTDLVCAS